MFDHASSFLIDRLQHFFEEFKDTEVFKLVSQQAEKKVMSDTRTVADFQPNHILVFTIKMKGMKRSKEIQFPKKASVLTIGRDKSNSIVIEDSRVSRSHARVEYTDRKCEFIDLGSSCGSRLNGKKVLRSKLRAGDILEIGQSTLIFHTKKKPRFSFASFFFSSN